MEKKDFRHRPFKSPTGAALEDRFWGKVATSENEDACWLWLGAKTEDGYGQILRRSDNGTWRTTSAHRLSWELNVGPIPTGFSVLHTCDTPPCVRPSHLFLGTITDNRRDQIQKRRHLYGERGTGSKLTHAAVEAIRRYKEDGKTQCSVAKEYGISQGLVSQICSGKRWPYDASGGRVL